MSTKARQQLNRLIETIQQAEIRELERQRKRLAAYMDSHKADMEEDTDIAIQNGLYSVFSRFVG